MDLYNKADNVYNCVNDDRQRNQHEFEIEKNRRQSNIIIVL